MNETQHELNMADLGALQLDAAAVIEFLTALVVRFTDPGEFSKHLPEVLASAGRFLNCQRISLTFNEGNNTQEYAWSGSQWQENDGTYVFQTRLKSSNSGNFLKFHLPDASETRQNLCLLIASLIDSKLAAEQAIQSEHSQRLLAESINQISRILTSTLDREELLSLFLDQLETLVPYDSATVMLLKDGLLYMHARRGYEDPSGSVDISKTAFVPNETFLMDEVLCSNQPVINSDAQSSEKWVWTPGSEHVRSWMGVPLRVKDTNIGFFSLDKSVPGYFTEKHAELASALARHAALALDNANLYARLQEAHQELRGLSARVIDIQEKERQKIAIELHDHTGQALLALRAELQVLRHNLLKDAVKAQRQIDYLDDIVLQMNHDMERLAYDLLPPTLSALGLVSAIEQYIGEFERRMDIRADFVHDGDLPRLTGEVELVCYRIVQEALTNLARHAQADRVEITFNYYEGVLHLVVKDNGVGIASRERNGRRGFGLVGIRERLAHIDGTLEINSRPGCGTELVVCIPLEADRHG